MPNRRLVSLALLAASAVLLSACAGLRTVDSEISTFGAWPPERKPGTYAFERLPSQEANANEQQALENAARGALQQAGFSAVAVDQKPDVLVQVGARLSRTLASPWDDPLWWHGGFGYGRGRPWGGPGWGFSTTYANAVRYVREVALLMRERETGKPLFEARASHDSISSGGAGVTAAMFEAALKDFPRTGINPRRVSVALPQ